MPSPLEPFGHYILVGRKIQLCRGLLEWARWMETGDRLVGRTELLSETYGRVLVSTIFLGLVHHGNVLFETMVFRDKTPAPDDELFVGFWGEMRRYRTFTQAEAGHQDAVKQLLDMGLTSIGTVWHSASVHAIGESS